MPVTTVATSGEGERGMNIREAINGHMLDGRIAGQSPSYLKTKENRLKYFAEWLEQLGITTLEAVTSNAVRGFIVHLQEMKAQSRNPHRPTEERTLSPLTIKSYMLNLRAFFSWCKAQDFLPKGFEDPSRRVPHVKVPQYVIATFTPKQLAEMIDSCDLETDIGFRDYAILLMLIDTGVRASELCGLTLGNVHEDYIKVFGKGSKEREVGIGMTASRALWMYIHKHRPHLVRVEREQHVFLGWDGSPLLRSGLYQIIARIGEKTGIEGVRISPHTFRHTFARSWLENGGEIFKLSRLLGHAELQTTEKYLKDFRSREARVEQPRFSPVERMKLGKQHRSKKEKNKGKKGQ